MIRRRKIGVLAFVFILATGFLNLDAGRSVRSTQLRKPLQKPLLLPKQAPQNVAGQLVQNKGLWESIKEKGPQEGLKSWWYGSQAVELGKKEEAHKLLERNKVALLAKHEIEKDLEQETDPSKKAWFRSQLETLKQFIVDNKKALGALGALAVAAGTAAYFARAKGEKSPEGSAGQEPVLKQGAPEKAIDQVAQMRVKKMPETSLESPESVRLTDKETPTSSLPSLLSTNQFPASTSSLASTNVQEKPRSKSWTSFLFAPPVLGQRFPSERQQQTNWGGEQVKEKRQSLAGQTELQQQAAQQPSNVEEGLTPLEESRPRLLIAEEQGRREQERLAEQAEQQPVQQRWTPPEEMRRRLEQERIAKEVEEQRREKEKKAKQEVEEESRRQKAEKRWEKEQYAVWLQESFR